MRLTPLLGGGARTAAEPGRPLSLCR